MQLTEDDQAVVFHDYELDRLTGETGSVRQRSAADMAGITLTGGSDRVPGFAEVLDMVAGQVPLLVEIKDQDGALGADVGPLEAAVAGALGTYNGPVAVMSFNPNAVAIVHKEDPELAVGLVIYDFASDADNADIPPARLKALTEIADYDRVGACFVSHDRNDLARPRIAELKQAGAAILCWTIRSKDQEAKARLLADNITFEGYLA